MKQTAKEILIFTILLWTFSALIAWAVWPHDFERALTDTLQFIQYKLNLY